ncbi:hypothetical protein BBO99_00009589 [Phytophthora kernoviae]|uniref:SGNH hydrolase-type esterase domain-containing protein n=1 Tax=Phytophthora kernoviae TaxID=325452 RepID=A0A3R7JAV8_9STRA|nr:hypothetical protein BBI17_009636 [Phytophthora kernoviae]RLN73024.1 hypothetical protein BBO99_00009589 [Phytophthora kernoviae]
MSTSTTTPLLVVTLLFRSKPGFESPPHIVNLDLVASADHCPVFYFIGDSITEHASNPDLSGFITLLQKHYVRSIDTINRGLSGYNTKWVREHAVPIYAKELQFQYSASFVTVFLGANDAVLKDGPDKAQYVSLEDYRANLLHILHTVKPLLPPHGKILLITLPAVINKGRWGDRSNASAEKYAQDCVEVAQAENVHVLDLHTYFNTTYPKEEDRKACFVDGLHFSAKGNKDVGKLLCVAINGIFDKEGLDRFNKWQLPNWHDFVHTT